jgi:hypothetical protein
MPKQLVIELDPQDGLDAKLLLDYIAAGDQQQWLKRCLLVGYLVVSGELQVVEEDQAGEQASTESSQEGKPRKGVGAGLFGIKR